jgi:hypothetical protein
MKTHVIPKGINIRTKYLGVFTAHTMSLIIAWGAICVVLIFSFGKNLYMILILIYSGILGVFLSSFTINGDYLDGILIKLLFYFSRNKIWIWE